jgi:hypothetical protein
VRSRSCYGNQGRQPLLRAGDLGPHRGAAGGTAGHTQLAAERLDPIGEAAQARTAARVGSADAVVGDLHIQPPVRVRDIDAHGGRAGVLDDVRERLCDEVVGGGPSRRANVGEAQRSRIEIDLNTIGLSGRLVLGSVVIAPIRRTTSWPFVTLPSSA